METGRRPGEGPPIVTLTMNPAIDLSTSVEKVVPFRKLRCSAAQRDAGGGGINVARVLHRLEVPCVAVHACGGLAGQLLRQLLDRDGITNLAVPIAGDTREDFTVLDNASREQLRFVLPGPSLSAAEWSQCLEVTTSVRPCGPFIVASGSLPPGVPDSFYGELASTVAAQGRKLILDSSGPPLGAALEAGVFMIKPSLRELRELVRAPLPDEASWIEATRAIVGSGRAEAVALSLGDLGAMVVTRRGAWRATAPQVTALSVVGAGDSFLASFVSALAANSAWPEALQMAVAAGTAALLAPGTDLCHPADIARLAKNVAVSVIA